MLDFGALPPEIISGQIYAGPGPSSLETAAQSWRNLAEELDQTATAYHSVISGLGEVWRGPSSTAMITAAAPYILWMRTTAIHALNLGTQARSAATAASAVKAEVVSPSIIAANRTQLIHLVSTNILGQNTPAIAANEADYSAMWAQDTAAMNTYQSSSQSATSAVVPFTSPTTTTTTISPVAATAASSSSTPIFGLGADTLVGQYLQAVISSGVVAQAPTDLIVGLIALTAVSTVVVNQQDTERLLEELPALVSPAQPTGAPVSSTLAPVSASSATADRMGPLSVPPKWAQQQPVPRVVTPLENTKTTTTDTDRSPVGFPVLPMVPVTGGKAKKRQGYSDPDDMHYGAPSPPVLPRHPSGG